MTDPFARFASWYAEAQKAIAEDPNAMVLSTVGADGRPSARVVLMKGFDTEGFVFYTNLESRKGRELDAHPAAALNFYFPPLHRQVRVEGLAHRVSSQEADRYFATRPRGSQVSAWASAQSAPLESRARLEARVAEVEARYRGQPVPRPPHWSGFRLVPDLIEFWEGRENRLHEREVFRRERPGAPWTHQHLYP
ncbi:MAG: pyridoxamine 5'-phosphate oxidase [Myxococcaceae bacterium]